jgi:hypothetical protein
MMKVRFFGSFDYATDDVKKADFVKLAYAKGVPMGGDLKPGAGKAPTFLVMALKDPSSGNLDRIQIVKGWLDAAGIVVVAGLLLLVAAGERLAGVALLEIVVTTAPLALCFVFVFIDVSEAREALRLPDLPTRWLPLLTGAATEQCSRASRLFRPLLRSFAKGMLRPLPKMCRHAPT